MALSEEAINFLEEHSPERFDPVTLVTKMPGRAIIKRASLKRKRVGLRFNLIASIYNMLE